MCNTGMVTRWTFGLLALSPAFFWRACRLFSGNSSSHSVMMTRRWTELVTSHVFLRPCYLYDFYVCVTVGLVMLPVAVARFSFNVNAIRYVLPVLWMAARFQIMGPESSTTLCFVEFDRRTWRNITSCTGSEIAVYDFTFYIVNFVWRGAVVQRVERWTCGFVTSWLQILTVFNGCGLSSV